MQTLVAGKKNTRKMVMRDENGETKIEALCYTFVREAAPIYVMGNTEPLVRSRTSNYIQGSFNTLDFTGSLVYHDSEFEIEIQEADGAAMLFKGCSVLSMSVDGLDYQADFIAKKVEKKEADRLEELSNKKLSKRLLTTDY